MQGSPNRCPANDRSRLNVARNKGIAVPTMIEITQVPELIRQTVDWHLRCRANCCWRWRSSTDVSS